MPKKVYQVEVITKAKVENDSWYYLVKWAGYDSSDDTWEPAENLARCSRLTDSFWKHFGGDDDDDHHEGDVIEATQEWIDREKAIFHGGNPKETKRKKPSLAKPRKQVTASASTSRSPVVAEPVAKTKAKGKQRAKPESKSLAEETSSDDEPLAQRPRFSSTDAEQAKARTTPTKKSKPNLGIDTSSSKLKKRHQEPSETPTPASGYNAAAGLFTPSPDGSPTGPKSGLTIALPPLASALPQPPPRSSFPRLPMPRFAPDNDSVKLKIPPLPSNKAPQTGSALATKHRLGEGALELIPPKRTLLKSLPKIPKINASVSESARQHNATDATDPSSSDLRDPEPSFHRKSPSLPPRMPSTSLFLPSVAEASPSNSPIDPMLVLPNDIAPLPFEDQMQVDTLDNPDDLSSAITDLPKSTDMLAAEQFLQSIMPAGLAAPLEPMGASQPVPDQPVVTLGRMKLPSLPRIPKIFKWHGSLFTGGENKFCDVSLVDVSDPPQEGFRFKPFLDHLDSIHVKNFFDLVDIEMVMLACGKVHQLGRLIGRESGDREAMTTLAEYMSRYKKAICYPLMLDGQTVAYLIIFNPSKPVSRRFHIPADMLQHQASLITALVPGQKIPCYLRDEWRRPIGGYTSRDYKIPYMEQNKLQRALRTNPGLIYGFQMLKFPPDVYEFLKTPRKFLVWYEGGDGTRNDYGMQTRLLLKVLKDCGGQNQGYNKDVRVAFVHVGALRTLPQLVAFAERRVKRPEINFYTYGSHESISPDRWGIRPIYPIGGVVTFMPRAILENPYMTMKRIEDIDTHTLWESYVLPSVLGCVAKCSTVPDDPVLAFESGNLLCAFLLDFVYKGRMAMMKSPPADWQERSKLANQYIGKTWDQEPWDRKQYLEYAVNQFDTDYGHLSKEDAISAIEADIIKDLLALQQQPAMMDAYRRFVVIKAADDKVHHGNYGLGLECVTIDEFDFRDNLFKKQKGAPVTPVVESLLYKPRSFQV